MVAWFGRAAERMGVCTVVQTDKPDGDASTLGMCFPSLICRGGARLAVLRPAWLPITADRCCTWLENYRLHCLPPSVMQSQGFVVDGKVRTIPLEVMVQGDKVPVYEETLEENGR